MVNSVRRLHMSTFTILCGDHRLRRGPLLAGTRHVGPSWAKIRGIGGCRPKTDITILASVYASRGQVLFTLRRVLPVALLASSLCVTTARAGTGFLYSAANLDTVTDTSAPIWTLMKAAAHGDTKEIAKFLAHGGGVNQATGYRETALMFAARYGQLNAVKLLLARHADPNLQTKGGENTALVLASCYAGPDVVRLLLKHGADPNILPNAREMMGNPPALGTAIECGNIQNARVLLDHGAKLRNSLEHAIEAKRLDMVQLLLAHGATVRRNISMLLYVKKIATPQIRKLLHLDRYHLLGENDAVYPAVLDELARKGGVVRKLYQYSWFLLPDYPPTGGFQHTYNYLDVQVMRNTIFARYDYAFDTVWLRKYFTKHFPNYRPLTKKVHLTKVDQRNLAFIKNSLEYRARDWK